VTRRARLLSIVAAVVALAGAGVALAGTSDGATWPRDEWSGPEILAPGSATETPPASPPTQPPTSAYQDEILADGVVTDAEYDAAIEQWVGCLESKGIRTFPSTNTQQRRPGFVGGTNEQVDRNVGEVTNCFDEYIARVEWEWTLQNAKTPDGNEVLRAVAACARDAGVPLSSLEPGPDEYMELFNSAEYGTRMAACADAMQEQFYGG